MKQEKGLSLIALIIIVVIVAVIVAIGIKNAKGYIEKEKNEDIKTTMLQIQAKITEIDNKHTVDEAANNLVGEELNLGDTEIEYNISNELRVVLEHLDKPELYILTQENIDNMSIKNVKVDKDTFYIVDYNTDDVFYSLGINGVYSLLEMEGKTKETEENDIENDEEDNEEIEEEL